MQFLNPTAFVNFEMMGTSELIRSNVSIRLLLGFPVIVMPAVEQLNLGLLVLLSTPFDGLRWKKLAQKVWKMGNSFELRLSLLNNIVQSRLQAEHRTALMTICVFCAFALCTTMSISLRFVIIVVGNMFEYAEFAWLPDVSNLLMNIINTIVMPIVFFILTRGFRDLFFCAASSSHKCQCQPFQTAQVTASEGKRRRTKEVPSLV